MSENFAKRLKQERERKGLTQENLAKSLGLTNGSISGYERNYREPDFDTLIKVAKLLDVSVSYLLGETDVFQPFFSDEGSGIPDPWNAFINNLRDMGGKLSPEQMEAFRSIAKVIGVKGTREG